MRMPLVIHMAPAVMRRFTGSRLIGPRCCHIATDSHVFFQLYGRHMEPMNETVPLSPSPPLKLEVSNNSSLFASQLPAWSKALKELSAQLYAAPHSGFRRRSAIHALEVLNNALSLPHERRMPYCQSFWHKALAICGNIDEGEDIRSAALLATVLYYGDKHKRVLAFASNVQWLREKRAMSVLREDTQYILRLCIVYVLSSSFVGASFRPDMVECIKMHAENALRVMRGGEALETAREYRVFLYALDWYVAHCGNIDARDFIRRTFDPLVSDKLRPFIFRTDEGVPVEAFKKVSPASILRMGERCRAEGNTKLLRQLFTEVKHREDVDDRYRLFKLSSSLGNMLSLMSDVDSRTQSDIVACCGTSLSHEALAKIGGSSRNCSAVLRVLWNIGGEEAYFASRQVLFHRSPEEALAFQNECGDVLLADRSLVWETALRSMSESIGRGDINWRETLPTALRLLSDAGKNSVFFQLLRESHREDETASLMTASALGQATRRSGQWWRALDVVDMIAACDPPRTTAEDMFLQDACLQTIYALRDAKRWKEALAFYTSFASIALPPIHRLFCSVVCGMPPSSPWEAALTVAQTYGEVPEKFLRTLRCARTPDVVMCASTEGAPLGLGTSSLKSRRFILQGFAEGGHWHHALQCVLQGAEGDVDFSSCVSLLRAAQRTSLGSLPGTFFSVLPDCVWGSAELLRLCLLAAEAHGIMGSLCDALEKHENHQIATEYLSLTRFLIDGRLPPDDKPLSNRYVIYRILMSPLPSSSPAMIRVKWTKDALAAFESARHGGMKAFVQSYFRLHPSCVPKKLNRENSKTFALRSVMPQGSLQECNTLVAVLPRMLAVADKPSGTSTHAYARAVAQRARVGPMHTLAYLLSSSSSGLILLLSSSIPTKAVRLEMKIFLRVCPLGPSSIPLLSTTFYTSYKMEVVAASLPEVSVTVEATCSSDTDGLMAGSLYRLKESVSAEGWGICGVETDEAAAEEGLHVAALTLRLLHDECEGERVMLFETTNVPAWLRQACDE
ncbi:hypothetical protein, conserved [Trypanosoma brucei gambiense DAL972]|uniref:Uncharacterized protein n=1 Tax=Trypanosoma brucei gambiense (strain MHOM/CI/86/DAL972) TaxID=679716 RepID=C9ZKL2_TRYB9|nr:hypothetical protein, conserved [Trypanosoma brucei gambiense DAL972]CBH09978.1 hypothetical protein, conserved [Trypanosoma brucei gambiense DAL972]|eukprot:XP_011772269.1 hypothetical protein, conserved [Trypanosoma brucei gambiense DAL972]